MSAIYDAYKPLRNYLRTCNRGAALIDIWQVSPHITNRMHPPNRVGLPPYASQDRRFLGAFLPLPGRSYFMLGMTVALARSDHHGGESDATSGGRGKQASTSATRRCV